MALTWDWKNKIGELLIRQGEREAVERIADHLLAAGVIVPPCRVGDTVWHIRRTPEHMGGSYIVEAKVVCIPIRVYADEVYSDIIIRYTQRNVMPEEASSKLGKYAFLTKEEAEKALAERREP